MYDTTVMLKPPASGAGDDLREADLGMDAKLQFPGLTNTWTMPIENRLDMELTGIKTQWASRFKARLGTASRHWARQFNRSRGDARDEVDLCGIASPRILHQRGSEPGGSGALWINRGDVQRTITSGIGGENITENIEGRERYPISVRYALDFQDDIQKLERVVIATPSNAQVPLGELAKISFSKGRDDPDEDAALTGYVYLDLNTRTMAALSPELTDSSRRSSICRPATA